MKTSPEWHFLGFLLAMALSSHAQTPPTTELSVVLFASAAFNIGEQDDLATIRVVRTWPGVGEVQVDYSTVSATALEGLPFARSCYPVAPLVYRINERFITSSPLAHGPWSRPGIRKWP